MVKPNGKKILIAKCKQHPRYTAEQKPKHACGTCWLLYIMRWQHDPKAEAKLGSLNAYVYLMPDAPLEDACSGIQAQRTETAQV